MPENILRWRIPGACSRHPQNSVAQVPSPSLVFRGALEIAVTRGPLSHEVARKTRLLMKLPIYYKRILKAFLGGAVVKNLPANAGDTGSSPGPGRSHMLGRNKACAPQLLSLCSRAREPQLLSPCATTTEARVPRARALQREATSVRSLCTATKSSPLSPQLQKACAQQQRPNAAKNK